MGCHEVDLSNNLVSFDSLCVCCSQCIKASQISSTGNIAQSVTCLATDATLTADPGVASSILAQSHTFVEIDYEIISMVIFLSSTESFKKDCCQLVAKYVHEVLVNCLFKLSQEKSVVR